MTRITHIEARYRVALAFRAEGQKVYEDHQGVGQRSVPDLVVMDPATGALSRVRVMVGKRPRPTSPLYHDRRREGPHADVVAVLDPRSMAVDFRAPAGGDPADVVGTRDAGPESDLTPVPRRYSPVPAERLLGRALDALVHHMRLPREVIRRQLEAADG